MASVVDSRLVVISIRTKKVGLTENWTPAKWTLGCRYYPLGHGCLLSLFTQPVFIPNEERSVITYTFARKLVGVLALAGVDGFLVWEVLVARIDPKYQPWKFYGIWSIIHDGDACHGRRRRSSFVQNGLWFYIGRQVFVLATRAFTDSISKWRPLHCWGRLDWSFFKLVKLIL